MVSTPRMNIAILSGMSATGKSEVALNFAEAHNKKSKHPIEIINADSVQIFRKMDIGSAKPSLDERERVAHHLIDIRNPDQPFSAGEFRRSVEALLTELTSQGKRALIVG